MAWNHLALGAFSLNESCGGSLSSFDTDRLFLVSMFSPIASRDCQTKVCQSGAWEGIESCESSPSLFRSTVCLLIALLAFAVFVGNAHLSRLI